MVCHSPSSNEERGPDEGVRVTGLTNMLVNVIFRRELESLSLCNVLVDAGVIGNEEVCGGIVSMLVIKDILVVCCPTVVMVIVAGGRVTVVACSITVVVEIKVSVATGTKFVKTIVTVVGGPADAVCVIVCRTVVVAPIDPPGVGAATPPSTGTTEYDALGSSNGSGFEACG